MPPKARCLNPVFVTWLEEMRDEVGPESKMRSVYNRAIKSMREHNRYLEHPKDCAEVKYVGPRLRDRLIRRHNESQVGVAPAPAQDSTKPSTSQTKVSKPRPRTTKNQALPDVNSSSDVGVDAPLPRQSRIGGTPSLNALNSVSVTTTLKQSSRGGRTVTSKTLSGSESEPGPMEGATPIKAPQVKLPPRPQKVAPTPRSSKHTKPVPERPRLSDFIPAPAATSDIEPDDDHLDWAGNTSSELLVFPAGTYTIQLILDEREVKSMKNRDYMLEGLLKRGVDTEKRALEIGDVCWVARLKDPVEGSRVECVLDYIVERKRMDDLKSSIVDGRFHEQKFRMKHTGISHVYYLVEDYDTERIARQWREQINTALSSTQVIDNFFLKETTSIEDTLNYLSRLHKTILMLHKDRALYIIPPQLIKRHSFLVLKQRLNAKDPKQTYHTTYQSYQVLNRKNGFYTVQDNMARILQCVRGLSEEKIAALIKHYPTPRSLYEAFKEAEEKQSGWEDPTPSEPSGKGKGKRVVKSGAPAPEMMLAELGGQGRRKIGPALSKHICEIFMAHAYES